MDYKKEFDKIFEEYKKVKFAGNLQEEQQRKYEYVYYSNKLEGNLLDLSQTTTILKDNIIVGNKVRFSDVLETKGHYKALGFVFAAAMNKYPFSDKIIKETNKLLLSSLWKNDDNYYATWKAAGQELGKCKIKNNKILYDYKGKQDEIMSFSTPENANKNLKKVIEEFNASKSHLLEKASFLAYNLFINQFFPDGNKRTARLMTSFVTMKEGLPITVFNKTKTNFNQALLSSHIEKDKTILKEFIAKNLMTEMSQRMEQEKKLNQQKQNGLTFFV